MLSKRQQVILRFLYDYSQINGFFPTIREICQETHTASTSVISYNLGKMVERGYLRHSPRRSRSNTLTKLAYDFLKVSPNTDPQIVRDGDLLEREVQRLRLQVENLRRAHRVEIESYLEERALLIEEITQLKQAVLA
ncbi:MAG: winged helix DNA-binding protein [Anaerolineae bacterium]|nr:winged helix DNA-binding protein [Anaerolineae bacterium]